MGREVNLAARLMTTAKAEQILISERLSKLEGFDYNHVGDLTYKGFDDPIPTYELLREETAAERVFDQALVGRDEELQQLAAFSQSIFAGNLAGVALIYGEPGIGKSHLSFALREALAAGSNAGPDILWLRGQSDPILSRAFNPFIYFLKGYFGQSTSAGESENKAAFERRLHALLADLSQFPDSHFVHTELVRTQSFLAALLDLHWPDSLYEQLDAEGRYQNTIIAVRTLLQVESRRQPMVLELEDGHWLDEASQELLTLLSRQTATAPLLILITSRYADDGSHVAYKLAPTTPTLTLHLATLSDTGLADLARMLLGGPIDATLRSLLLEKTHANPFFAQQMLLYFRENSMLSQSEDGIWQLAGDYQQQTPDSQLPITLNTLLLARLDRLPRQVKEVVQTAAVLGREFESRLLTQMLARELTTELESAEKEQIWTALNALQYIFNHVLLRDAAYGMQLRVRLKELHYLAALAGEQLYASQLAAYTTTLAYHYETAYLLGQEEAQEAAIHYLQQAGQQAWDNFEHVAAESYFSRALAILPETATTKQVQLLLQREAVYHLIGKREAQAHDLAALAALTKVIQLPDERTELLLRQAEMAIVMGDFAQAQRWAEQGATLAQTAGNVVQEAAAQLQWGEALLWQGKHDAAREQLERSLSLAQVAQSPLVAAGSLRNLGFVARHQGDYETTQTFYEQSLAIYQEIGNRLGEAKALNNLSFVARHQGDYETAQTLYEQSLAICREIGNRLGEAKALNNLGFVTQLQGDYETAQTFYEQSLAIHLEIGNRSGEEVALYNLGNVTHTLGDYETARALHEQSLTICREIGDRHGEGYALTGLGDALNALGHTASAQSNLRAAIVLRQELGSRVLVIESQVILAHVHYQQGDLAKARALITEVQVYWADTGHFDGAEYPTRLSFICYQVLQMVGDPQATIFLQNAYEQILLQANKFKDERKRQIYWHNIPWHRAITAAY